MYRSEYFPKCKQATHIYMPWNLVLTVSVCMPEWFWEKLLAPTDIGILKELHN